jgi:hypothetical protein
MLMLMPSASWVIDILMDGLPYKNSLKELNQKLKRTYFLVLNFA